ncbi:TIGR03086 family metal-binding protein [Streptomyces axinellae]|uniref:TIGR03086 family metal-binding protein n=1 Tax=Streptomyces axinellae TaxID=552788 RepID=A0ABN3Q183_9ACTN
MTETGIDIGPAARRMAVLVDGAGDAALDSSTPCERFALRDLLAHVIELSVGFQYAARKELGDSTERAPSEHGPGPLPEDWRAQLARGLEAVTAAWRSPAAWQGDTQAGGVSLTGAVAGRVLLNELVVHGWDVARATGQEPGFDEESLRTVHTFLADAVRGNGGEGLFGPVVQVPEDAPLLDRVVALTGRDPAWRPTGT